MRGRPRWSDRPDGPSIRLEEWLARTPEDAIEPELPIIDSHHHLWDRRPLSLSGEAPDSSTAMGDLPQWIGRLPLCYLGDNLMDDIRGGGHNVVDTVFIDSMAMYRANGGVNSSIGETEFANGIAATAASNFYGSDARCCGAIISHVDLTLVLMLSPCFFPTKRQALGFEEFAIPTPGMSRQTLAMQPTPLKTTSDSLRAKTSALDSQCSNAWASRSIAMGTSPNWERSEISQGLSQV